ncbi:MAG TPA: hypothetical protein VK573_12410 [Gemmatimonadales bacterium]|nr:hypothetical protein [Gemmatimonadales bacterium]
MRISTLTATLAILLLVASCGRDRRGDAEAVRGRSADSGSLDVDRAVELDAAANDVVAFLRGQVGFDRIRLADTVVLYVSPEGGGARAAFKREQLRHPSNWVVRSGRPTYVFAPRPGLAKVTTRVGRHFNCLEYPLSSRFAELARLPHVGVKLEPERAASCLQSWNVTLVFDATARPPHLVAAVYDQWEW